MLIATKPPVGFWIVALLSLLWSLAGDAAYLGQVGMGEAELAKLPPAQAAIWRMMPAWVTGAYAVAVWSSLVGSIMLLARRRWARPAFIVSLAGVVVQFGWTFLATPILTGIGPSTIAFPAFIAVAALGQIWFAGFAAGRRWLR